MPNLYVELRQSVLGVRVPEDTQMKGFRVKIGPNLDMEVPDVVQSAGGYRGSTAPQCPYPFIWMCTPDSTFDCSLFAQLYIHDHYI